MVLLITVILLTIITTALLGLDIKLNKDCDDIENVTYKIRPRMLFGLLWLILLLFGSFTTVNSGEIGLKVRFGKITNTPISEGINWKIPGIEKIVKVNVKVRKYENETALSTSSKDLQIINNIVINVNYQIDNTKAVSLYKNVGNNYEDVVITPAIQESVRSIISQYTAEELVTKRSEIANAINDNLNQKLNSYGINVLSTAIKNFDFSAEYNAAIEKKAVAEQNVLTAQQELEKTKIDAEAKKVKAQGDADANMVLEKTLTRDVLLQQFIEKWDGKLSTVSGNENGFINISDFIK